MSRPKKRTKTERFTKEAAKIVVEMLKDGVVKGKLLQANLCELAPEFSPNPQNEHYPYKIGQTHYSERLTNYRLDEDNRDIIGFTKKVDRKEFKRRWLERYPKETKPESKVETKGKSETKLTYPLFAKSKPNGAIFLFTSMHAGVCVFKGESENSYGEPLRSLVKATDTTHWQHLTFAEAEAEIFGEGAGNDTYIHGPRSGGNTQMQHPPHLQHVPHGRNRGV